MVNRCWTKDRNLTALWQKAKHTMPLLSPATAFRGRARSSMVRQSSHQSVRSCEMTCQNPRVTRQVLRLRTSSNPTYLEVIVGAAGPVSMRRKQDRARDRYSDVTFAPIPISTN